MEEIIAKLERHLQSDEAGHIVFTRTEAEILLKFLTKEPEGDQ